MLRDKKRNFSAEFKLEAAKLVLDHGYQVKQACEAMNVSKSAMTTWLRQLREERAGKPGNTTPLTSVQRELVELKKQVKQLERENEILKKATALLVLDGRKNIC